MVRIEQNIEKAGVFLLSVVALVALSACAGIRSRYHTVCRGENLLSIAKQYDIPVSELEKRNQDKGKRGVASLLKPGDKLYIPFEENKQWNAEFADDLYKTHRDLAADGAPSETSTDPRLNTFSWPVAGRVSSKFGFRNIGRKGSTMHEGIDIAARLGTPVRSARAGHVIYASSKIPGYGRMVIVKHAGEYSTIYAHLSSYNVKKGQFIARGSVLGKVGKSGRSTGYHLHFEIRSKSAPVDPIAYLKGKEGVLTVSSR